MVFFDCSDLFFGRAAFRLKLTLLPSSIQLKYIFPAIGLPQSKENYRSVIFAALEGALCRASLD